MPEPTTHLLAHRSGIALVFLLLMGQGALCSECGHGTRVTSKRWAQCKECGTRVRRRSPDWAMAEIEAHAEEKGKRNRR